MSVTMAPSGAVTIARAAGATEAWAAPIAQQHILGGTAMGSDPARSVTNGFGQAHDHENQFLAGSGLFPTSGVVDPTFTLSAPALRSAERIVRNWFGLAWSRATTSANP